MKDIRDTINASCSYNSKLMGGHNINKTSAAGIELIDTLSLHRDYKKPPFSDQTPFRITQHKPTS